MNSDCPKLVSVGSLFDGELTAEEHDSLIRHLGACATCRQEFADLNRLRATLASVVVAPSARERVLRSLPAIRPAAPFSWKRVSVPLPIAAAILLLLAISILGNAYLGFRQKGRERASREGSIIMAGAPPPQSPAVVEAERPTGGPIRPAANLPGKTAAASMVNRPATGSESPRSIANPLVFTLISDQGIVQCVTTTEYKPYRVPKIYAGGIVDSSEKR
jgi:hypothetical protein